MRKRGDQIYHSAEPLEEDFQTEDVFDETFLIYKMSL